MLTVAQGTLLGSLLLFVGAVEEIDEHAHRGLGCHRGRELLGGALIEAGSGARDTAGGISRGPTWRG